MNKQEQEAWDRMQEESKKIPEHKTIPDLNELLKPLADKWADDLVKDGLVNEDGTITMSEWSNLQGDFYISNDNPIYNKVIDVTPNYTIRFFNKDQKEVGNFDFNGDKLKFEGDVEESAEVFINFLLNCFHKRIDEIKEATYDQGYFHKKNEE